MDGELHLLQVAQPNGVVSEYSYDNGSRLISITYKKSGVTIGTLTYQYDALGRRTAMGGSLAQVNLPAALTTTAYNEANQQTAFGSQTLTYDNNGNLTEITDRKGQVTLSCIAFCL